MKGRKGEKETKGETQEKKIWISYIEVKSIKVRNAAIFNQFYLDTECENLLKNCSENSEDLLYEGNFCTVTSSDALGTRKEENTPKYGEQTFGFYITTMLQHTSRLC
jgi:hypothetical protein